MAEYQITYWQEIPAMVTAQAGRRNRARVELPPRFQEAIDAAAMRAGLAETDAYLEQWRRGEWQERAGAPADVAAAVARELDAAYTPERMRALVRAAGEA